MILVRKGNPKGIHDFSDLAKPGVRLIHPDPGSSGGAQWSILAMYGSELVKSKQSSGGEDRTRALTMLQAIWRNVISTPASAREARTTFELGNGDALITYELDALLMSSAGWKHLPCVPNVAEAGEETGRGQNHRASGPPASVAGDPRK